MPDRRYEVPAADDSVQQLVDMLQLQRLDPEDEQAASGRSAEDHFLGPVFKQAYWRVFGGQVLAQAATAAMATVDPDRLIHSVHGYFLRPGDASKPIQVSVERLRDGGSFSARRSQAYQDGTPILSMIASFQRPSAGVSHQRRMPEGVPDPEDLAPPQELVGHVKHPIVHEWAHGRPFDIRHVDRPIYLEADQVPHATSAVWLKTKAALPDDPNIHRAAILYASDYTLLEPVLRRHGLYWAKPEMKVASLDHAMWWHRDARADEWLLYVQQSPSAQNARGLAQGSIYSRDGALVASVAQEGMVRPPQGLRPKLSEKMQQTLVNSSRATRTINKKYSQTWTSRYLET